MIEVQGLTKVYPTGPALRGIAFAASAGERVALLGRNGAGKTTALRLLAGVLEPSAGRIRIDGRLLGADPAWRARVGYLPDRPPLHDDMDVRAYLEHVARLRGLDRRAARAATAGVIERCDLGEHAGRVIAGLSHGHRQRVGLAQALVHDPAVLLLDEPAAGLDPAQTVALRELLAGLAEELTLILSSHLLGEVARICTRFLVLEGGRLVRDQRGARDGARRVRLGVEAAAGARSPAAVLEEALGASAFEAEAPDRFLVSVAHRGAACRALLAAGHELLSLERPATAVDDLEALFREELS